jgi:hypothetical protein
MAAAMREIPFDQLSGAMTRHSAERIEVECLRGHFFKLELFSIDGGLAEPSLIGGALQFGTDRIALDPEHACQLAGRVRAAIDNSVAGSIIHRPAEHDGGH